MKEERFYHKNLKKHFENKRSYYSTDQKDNNRKENKRTLSPQNGRNEEHQQNLFEQNYSTVTSRSRQRQRSVSGIPSYYIFQQLKEKNNKKIEVWQRKVINPS